MGNFALLPALINAHTHWEFSRLERPLGRAGMRFADWIGEVVAFRRKLTGDGTDLGAYSRQATAAGLSESAEAGVAGLGEIATALWPAECFDSGSDIQGTVFLELLGLAPERIESLLFAAEQHINTGKNSAFRRGLSPHAPYTVHPDLLRKVCDLSAREQVPLAMHLAESLEET